MIRGMNHAVLYVRNSERHRTFYEDLLGFITVINEPGQYVFMRAPASENHHDIAFFAIGEGSGASQAGRQTVGMYHIAWEVATLAELAEMEQRLWTAGVLIGASDHGVNKSLYCKDPAGLECEVMCPPPADRWGDEEHEAIIRPLNIAADMERFADSAADPAPNSTKETA